MKDVLPVLDPIPGIYLSCVDPKDCRDSLYKRGSQKPRPVIYGAASTPFGFVFHNKDQCPVPRTSTFQTLEEFYAQDFLQTFTDCLKSSDFSTRGAKTMGFSSTVFFEGSTINLSGERVTASLLGANIEYPYECCMQPSFYIANVRGLQKNTPYYNPLFTTVHDFNCFAEDGCHAGGSLKNIQNSEGSQLEPSPPFDFPKASPRSVMWYMQHAIATVNLDESGSPTDFWEGGIVGKINAIGGTIDLGGLESAQKNLGGNAALFNSIKRSYGTTDTPSQAAQVSYGVFSCPTTDGSSIPPFNYWKANYMYPTPDAWSSLENTYDVECCARGTQYTNPATTGQGTEGGVGIIPERLLGFLLNAEAQSLAPDVIPIEGNAYTCSNYHCFESPYCQSLLARVCSNFTIDINGEILYGGYGGHCTRWRNWASNNYAPIQPSQRQASSYPTNASVIPAPPTLPIATAYPSGAYSSSVDQSVFTLIHACSSTDFSQPQPKEIVDQCSGLLSSNSLQTTFPRLRPITFDTPIVYSNTPVTPYTVDSTNNQIDVQLTYSQFVFIQDNNFLNSIINRNNPGTKIVPNVKETINLTPYLIIPKIENFVSLTTIKLDNFVALDSVTFYTKVRDNFNSKIKGAFDLFTPPPQPQLPSTSISENVPIGPFVYYNWQESALDIVPTPWPFSVNSQSISPAFINHNSDLVTWTDNSITVIHNFVNSSQYLTANPASGSTDPASPNGDGIYATRLNNITYLYNPINVLWNTSLDFFSNDQAPVNIPQRGRIPPESYNVRFNSLCVTPGNDGSDNFSDCWNYLANNFQNIVLDQQNGFVDLTIPSNLLRVDDRLTILFNQKLSEFLGLDGQGNSITINLNPMRGPNAIFPSISSNGTPLSAQTSSGMPITFSSPLPVQSPSSPINIFNLTNTSQFWLTNTTPIPIYSLSALNYSANRFSITFNPLSNPSSPFLPGTSVSVNIVDPSDPDNSGSFSAVPVLFYDSGVGGWQNNFNSPEFPVLGGILCARGIDISNVNSYGSGERFNSFSSDTSYELGEDFQGTISTILTYYKNQNVYTTGEANSGGASAISQMFLSPLI